MTRDFVGYGRTPPDAQWPGNAKIAVNFDLNYEAGGELSMLVGNITCESMLTEIGVLAYVGIPQPLAESIFEYGSRVGVWRLLRIFKRFAMRVSVLGVVRALQQNPAAVEAFMEDGHEIISHGWRWIDYHGVDEATEREELTAAPTLTIQGDCKFARSYPESDGLLFR